MIVFPLASALISAACAGVMTRDAFKRPRPDKVIWALAFVLFTLAAGAQVVASTWEWTSLLARTYYWSAAALVVAFLAIGELYLLFPAAMKRFGVGATLLITAMWSSLVWNATVDQSKLASDGWKAIDRGPEMIATSVVIDSVGTLIIVGGTAWSVWKFRKLGTFRNRMIGCALICVGTLVVAAGGSMTRLGHEEYLYIPMAIGVGMIFWGVLQTRRPEAGASAATTDNLAADVLAITVEPDETIATADAISGEQARTGIAFVAHLLAQTSDEIDRVSAEWSVAKDASAAMSRGDARRAWALRGKLDDVAIGQFDALPVASRRQLSTLYHDVLTWEKSGRDDIAELVTSDASVARQA